MYRPEVPRAPQLEAAGFVGDEAPGWSCAGGALNCPSCLRTFLSLRSMVHIMNMRYGEAGTMARNKVQFQKGLSEAGFEALYGTEEKCRAVVIALVGRTASNARPAAGVPIAR